MRKIITFLGVIRNPDNAGKYQYELNGIIHEGTVFAEALRQFAEFDEMLVFTTEEARQSSWRFLEALNDPRIIPVEIPIGQSETEIWDIFTKVVSRVDVNDIVIFDITQGLRSVPFLIFLFAAFLKSARNATIEAVYYGAFELGNAQEKRPAPILDLSSFVNMLDWLTASNQFTQTGDGTHLAHLLDTSGTADETFRALMDVSQAALLTHPSTLMKKVKVLNEALTNDAENIPLPFTVLRDNVANAFLPFGGDPDDSLSFLHAEYEMLLWYENSNQIMQLVTLAREYLIDMVCVYCGMKIDNQIDTRDSIRRGVLGISRLGRKEKTGLVFSFDGLNDIGKVFYPKLTPLMIEKIKNIENNLTPVRNAIDHAEHQKGGIALYRAIQKVRGIIMPEIKTLTDLMFHSYKDS